MSGQPPAAALPAPGSASPAAVAPPPEAHTLAPPPYAEIDTAAFHLAHGDLAHSPRPPRALYPPTQQPNQQPQPSEHDYASSAIPPSKRLDHVRASARFHRTLLIMLNSLVLVASLAISVATVLVFSKSRRITLPSPREDAVPHPTHGHDDTAPLFALCIATCLLSAFCIAGAAKKSLLAVKLNFWLFLLFSVLLFKTGTEVLLVARENAVVRGCGIAVWCCGVAATMAAFVVYRAAFRAFEDEAYSEAAREYGLWRV